MTIFGLGIFGLTILGLAIFGSAIFGLAYFSILIFVRPLIEIRRREGENVYVDLDLGI